jgi:hypothetical protein
MAFERSFAFPGLLPDARFMPVHVVRIPMQEDQQLNLLQMTADPTSNDPEELIRDWTPMAILDVHGNPLRGYYGTANTTEDIGHRPERESRILIGKSGLYGRPFAAIELKWRRGNLRYTFLNPSEYPVPSEAKTLLLEIKRGRSFRT